jgi:hypothetical protein
MKRSLTCLTAAAIAILGCSDAPSRDEEVAVSTAPLVTSMRWAYGWTETLDGVMSPTFQASSSGAIVRGLRSAEPGNYIVKFIGMARRPGGNGNLQIVPYGSNNHCSIVHLTDEFGDIFAKIHCWSPGPEGGFAATRFVASYIDDTRPPYSGSNDNIRAAFLRFSNNPTVDDTPFQWSSSGGPMSVTRVSPGRYRATFVGMAAPPYPPGGAAQVTAHASLPATEPTYCNVEGWGNTGPGWADGYVDVRCFGRSGVPTDSAFMLRYWTWGSFGGVEGAYAVDIRPDLASYSPPSAHQHVAGGTGLASILRPDLTAASWNVRFPGLSFTKSAALVGALGTDGKYCTIGSWSSGVSVNVRCFAPDGAPATTPFVASYFDAITGT